MEPEKFEDRLVKFFNAALDIKAAYEEVEDYKCAAGMCYVLDIVNDMLNDIKKEFLR